MSLFGGFVRERMQLFTKSANPQLENGDHILVEFGREKIPVYLFYQSIPVNAKLLVDLNKLPPLKRRVALTTVAKYNWDNYLDWSDNVNDVQKTAYTYTWGQIFLLAHTTKVLQDDRAHTMSLDALFNKGESVNYQIEGMFTISDWQLVRNTVKAGVAQDDRTRDTIRSLFHQCPLLFDHLIEQDATERELHDIGLKYADTYEIKDIPKDSEMYQCDPASVYGRLPHPIDGSALRNATSGDQENDWEVASISSLESNKNGSDEGKPSIGNARIAEADEEPTTTDISGLPAEDLARQLMDLAVQEVAAVQSKEKYTVSQVEDSLSDDGGIVLQKTEVPVQSRSDDTALCPPEDIASDEAGVASHIEESPVGQPADKIVDEDPDDVIGKTVNQLEAYVGMPDELQHLYPNREFAVNGENTSKVQGTLDAYNGSEAEDAPNAEEADALAQEYTFGFVPTRELTRTAPGSPIMSFDERRKVERRGQKRDAPELDEIEDRGGKHARHNGERWPAAEAKVKEARPSRRDREMKKPTKRYGNSALHALRERQAASTTAPRDTAPREEPFRKPKGPPASGKEMADEKAKDPKAWTENFGVAAPRPTAHPKKRVTFSLEEGVHFVDWDD